MDSTPPKDELLNIVTQETGLTPNQAKAAIETVIGYLKQRLPPSVSVGLAGIAGFLASLIGALVLLIIYHAIGPRRAG